MQGHNLAHRLSVAVLCMLYKIRCDPMHPLYVALPVPYVTVRITRGAVIAHRCTQGVKNIGRWTLFCDPLKKKNGMNSLEGIS